MSYFHQPMCNFLVWHVCRLLPKGLLDEFVDLGIWLDSIGPLTHPEPLVDCISQTFHDPREALVLEVVSRWIFQRIFLRPCFEILLCQHTLSLEIVHEATQLLEARP